MSDSAEQEQQQTSETSTAGTTLLKGSSEPLGWEIVLRCESGSIVNVLRALLDTDEPQCLSLDELLSMHVRQLTQDDISS